MTTAFKLFTTYQTRSVCDYDCIFSIQFIKRTAKTITNESGETFRIFLYDNKECIRPFGNYSMAPIISADKELAA